MLAIAGARLTIVGKEHPRSSEPRFYMANHQSALDIPIVLVVTGGNVRFFSKSSLFKIPIFGWILSRYGFVSIHKSKPRLTYQGLERMLVELRRSPISLAVFPEGTRTRDGCLSPFRKGTMRIATRAGLTVVPVAIDGSLAVNHRDEWRLRPGPIRVTLTEPIPGAEVRCMSPTDLHDRVVGAITTVLDQPPRTPVSVY
jgi:1-acyl-sn-glycerol-3-phosphate acyltransferase